MGRCSSCQLADAANAARTPADAWSADPTPLRLVAEEELRHLLLADVGRTIGGEGIRFRNLVYADPPARRTATRRRRTDLPRGAWQC